MALIQAAQLLQGTSTEVRFYGARGEDRTGEFLQSRLEQTPVKLELFKIVSGATPTTIVLSDPNYNKGHGERVFINDIGAARHMGPGDLEDGFFDAQMVQQGNVRVYHVADGDEQGQRR